MTALEGLARLIPPPSRAPTVDWPQYERDFGRGLPTDYKQFIDAYGSVEISELLIVLGPNQKLAFDLASQTRTIGTASEQVDPYYRTDKEEAEGVEETRSWLEALTAWGTTNEGHTLYWDTRDAIPEQWTVFVTNDTHEQWEHYPFGMVEFLRGLLANDLDPPSRLFSRTHLYDEPPTIYSLSP
ncbi:MAG: hypothetical protein ACRC20_17170 [Segniliparus sp.]|uniref:hypothetical protein n=1 Tax=Segniliparus sp. TaxID=2804064 RepID=UPI003F368F20